MLLALVCRDKILQQSLDESVIADGCNRLMNLAHKTWRSLLEALVKTGAVM
jgi:hypothetical protein